MTAGGGTPAGAPVTTPAGTSDGTAAGAAARDEGSGVGAGAALATGDAVVATGAAFDAVVVAAGAAFDAVGDAPPSAYVVSCEVGYAGGALTTRRWRGTDSSSTGSAGGGEVATEFVIGLAAGELGSLGSTRADVTVVVETPGGSGARLTAGTGIIVGVRASRCARSRKRKVVPTARSRPMAATITMTRFLRVARSLRSIRRSGTHPPCPSAGVECSRFPA